MPGAILFQYLDPKLGNNDVNYEIGEEKVDSTRKEVLLLKLQVFIVKNFWGTSEIYSNKVTMSRRIWRLLQIISVDTQIYNKVNVCVCAYIHRSGKIVLLLFFFIWVAAFRWTFEIHLRCNSASLVDSVDGDKYTPSYNTPKLNGIQLIGL